MLLDRSVAGIAIVALAGTANGSFPAPSKRITVWKWEHVWLVYSLVAMVVLPLGLGLLFGGGMAGRLATDEFTRALEVGGFGFLWGLGSLLFGRSLVRLGMAITNALISGVVVLSGSLGPLLMGAAPAGQHMGWLLGGLALLSVSLALCAAASIRRDRARKAALETTGSAVTGVLIAVLSGLFSSMLNYGFVTGAPLAREAEAAGCPAVFASVAIWIPALAGGLLPNISYPVYLLARNRSWGAYHSAGSAARWGRASLMGVLWFGAVFLYGFGASLMGRAGSVYGWALLVAVSILASNAWGVATGEWRGAGRGPKTLMWISTLLLITAAAVLAAARPAV